MLSVRDIEALAERLERARQIAAEGKVLKVLGPGATEEAYVVLNGKGAYLVVAGRGCTCPDFQHRLKERELSCKHMLAVQLVQERGGESDKGKAEGSEKSEKGGEREGRCQSCGGPSEEKWCRSCLWDLR